MVAKKAKLKLREWLTDRHFNTWPPERDGEAGRVVTVEGEIVITRRGREIEFYGQFEIFSDYFHLWLDAEALTWRKAPESWSFVLVMRNLMTKHPRREEFCLEMKLEEVFWLPRCILIDKRSCEVGCSGTQLYFLKNNHIKESQYDNIWVALV